MQSEIWKDIPGYQGYYQVSDFGRVRSVDRLVVSGCPWHANGMRLSKGKILRQNRHLDGRLNVGLFKEGLREERNVHRLVLRTFVSECPDGMEGCHNDGDASNNSLTNLRWDTHQKNMDDQVIHGTRQRGEKSHRAKLTVALIESARSASARGIRQRDIAAMIGVCQATISQALSGERWKHLKANA